MHAKTPSVPGADVRPERSADRSGFAGGRRTPDWGALASGRILIVDDDSPTRRPLAQILSDTGYDVLDVATARQARHVLEHEAIALLLSEVSMPGETGLDLLHFVVCEHPDTATLLMSAAEDPGIAQAALDFGAHGYLSKPLGRSAVLIGVMNALRGRELQQRERAAHEHVERVMKWHAQPVEEAFGHLEQATESSRLLQAETIYRWARAAESRVPDIGGHLERVSRYCGVLGDRLGLHADSLELASVLHDVGTAAIPDRILLKRDPLTPDERLATQTHANLGYEMLRGSSSSVLELAALVAWTHHEKFDGSGYPRGLTGTAIPLEGRIVAVADVFDSLISARPHRRGWSVQSTISWMNGQRGKHFDPEVVDAFALSIDDILAVRSARVTG